MKIAFLFNHDAPHQIAHTAPIIAELAALQPDAELSVLTSGEAQERHVRALLPVHTISRVHFHRLGAGPVAGALDRLSGGVVPLRRISVLERNLALLGGFDALVVPETTSALLRTRFGLTRPALIYLPHGAGDRSVGFRPVTAAFDLVLLSGPKVRDRMLAAGIIRPDSHAIVGYPKFDSVDLSVRPLLFADDRPVVLYNPHFDPKLSSWYAMGERIIDWFERQQRFNLIVAPHVMLFRRRLHASAEHRRMRVRRPIKTRAAPHILIDTGSARSVDMTYTRAADIYLGDASSQIYEWIARPRPAIFLNPGQLRWRGDENFAHWQLGEVIGGLSELTGALDRAVDRPDAFAAAQREAFERTFSLTDTPSSRRAAEAILAFLAARLR